VRVFGVQGEVVKKSVLILETIHELVEVYLEGNCPFYFQKVKAVVMIWDKFGYDLGISIYIY
jgi:hypothetical protein